MTPKADRNRLAVYIARVVAQAPKLTDRQLDGLSALIHKRPS